MIKTNEVLHDINSSINALEQGFYMLRNDQIADPKLKENLIKLMAESSLKLKSSWNNYKELENISPTNANTSNR